MGCGCSDKLGKLEARVRALEPFRHVSEGTYRYPPEAPLKHLSLKETCEILLEAWPSPADKDPDLPAMKAKVKDKR